jgi:hypothetical protein
MPADGTTRARYCHARKRQGAGLCTRPAGWGTPHPGIGRCKLHGGSASAASITHGLHSRFLHAHLAPLLAQAAAAPEPLTLCEELAVARAWLDRYLATHATLEAEEIEAFSKLLENGGCLGNSLN